MSGTIRGAWSGRSSAIVAPKTPHPRTCSAANYRYLPGLQQPQPDDVKFALIAKNPETPAYQRLFVCACVLVSGMVEQFPLAVVGTIAADDRKMERPFRRRFLRSRVRLLSKFY